MVGTKELPYSFPRRVDERGRISLLESMLDEVFREEREWAYLQNATVGVFGVPVRDLDDSDKRYRCIYVLPKREIIRVRRETSRDRSDRARSYRNLLRHVEGVEIWSQNRINISDKIGPASITCPGDTILYLTKKANRIEIWNPITFLQVYPNASSE